MVRFRGPLEQDWISFLCKFGLVEKLSLPRQVEIEPTFRWAFFYKFHGEFLFAKHQTHLARKRADRLIKKTCHAFQTKLTPRLEQVCSPVRKKLAAARPIWLAWRHGS